MIKDKSMGRKLIFLDIDGTLLPPGEFAFHLYNLNCAICISQHKIWGIVHRR